MVAYYYCVLLRKSPAVNRPHVEEKHNCQILVERRTILFQDIQRSLLEHSLFRQNQTIAEIPPISSPPTLKLMQLKDLSARQ